MSERPELRLVRERLESVLSPNVAGAALYEALGAGSPPTSAKEILGMVSGPLSKYLQKRLGEDEAREVIDDIVRALGHVLEGPDDELRRADSTLEIPPPGTHRLVVLVLSETDAMAIQLEGAIGAGRITTIAISSAVALRRALDETVPGVVIIDAARFPRIEPTQIAAAIAPLPRSVLRAVWGADLPFGAAATSECAKRGGTVTPLDRREGIAPLIDLVRARA